MSHTISRRTFSLGAIATAVTGPALFSLSSPALAAQQATAAASPLAGMGYPEVTVTITDKEIQLSPSDVTAGLVLLTVVNQSSDDNGAGILGPGPGQTLQDLQQAAATPTSGDEFPPFLYHATIAGGPGAIKAGATAQAVIELTEGDWAAFAMGNQPPAFLTVSAASGGTATEPDATVTIPEVDFAFGGFSQTFAPGPQVWKVINEGHQPHMLDISQIPAGTTLDQLLPLLSLSDNATPPPGSPNPAEFESYGGVILQSPGTTVWPVLDLPEGRYVMVCFMPDPMHGGIPHAMEGMITVFDVGGQMATPTS